MRSLSHVMTTYFQIYYNHNRMVKIDAPQAIIESGKKILTDLEEILKKNHDFDIQKFLNTPNGQEMLHRELIKIHSFEKASERCHICKKFTIFNGCKKKVIKGDEPYPVTCKQFEDSGFSNSLERISALVERCGACIHLQDDSENGYVCQKNLDMDEIICRGMEKKENV